MDRDLCDGKHYMNRINHYSWLYNSIGFEMKMWSSQLWLWFKQSQSKPEKCFRGFNGIRTHALCVSAAVLHQLSYEDPYVGSRPIYWIHRTRERSETYEYYVNCGHTSEMRMWSSQLWLRKHFSGLPCDCLNRNHNCDDHIFISFVCLQFT